MYCPQCGTKATTDNPRFCYECGAEIPALAASEQGETQGEQGAWSAAGSATMPPHRQVHAAIPVVVKDSGLKTVLMVIGGLALLPIALVVLVGAVLASLVAGAAVIAVLFKLAPLIAIGFLVYWFATRQHRMAGVRR